MWKGCKILKADVGTRTKCFCQRSFSCLIAFKGHAPLARYAATFGFLKQIFPAVPEEFEIKSCQANLETTQNWEPLGDPNDPGKPYR